MKNIILNFLQSWRKYRLKRIGVEFEGLSYIDLMVTINLRSPFFQTGLGSCKFGDRIKLSKGVTIDSYGGKIEIGNNVFIGPYTLIYGHGGVFIGDNALIAPGCKLIAANHTVPGKTFIINQQPDIELPIFIGNDVWLGADVKVLAGVTIGDGCVVGAGSVVTESLPPYTFAVGVPAKVIKERR